MITKAEAQINKTAYSTGIGERISQGLISNSFQGIIGGIFIIPPATVVSNADALQAVADLRAAGWTVEMDVPSRTICVK